MSHALRTLTPTNVTRPRLGLALSGGAARGFAHVGVLRALERHNLSVDMIAGTSVGAIVGGAYAAGVTLDELLAFGRAARWRNLGRMTLARGGLQSNQPLETLLRARLPVESFDQLRIPFAAVAADLDSGEEVMLTTGDLAFAIRASCTLPGLYVPVIDDRGRQLIDGGLVANLPVGATLGLGADVVIAVDVNFEGAKFLGRLQSFQTTIGVLFQSLMIAQRAASSREAAQAHVQIRPRVGHIRWDEMRRADELIKLGEEATEEAIPQIRAMLDTHQREAQTLSKMT